MCRASRGGKSTARQLRDRYASQLSLRRVHQILAADPDLSWIRMPRTPYLMKTHKVLRLLWAREMKHKCAPFWCSVVNSDESRFSLYGSDALANYWRDERRSDRYHATRRNNGGSTKVWVGVSFRGKNELVFVPQTLDSSWYRATPETAYLPFVADTHPRGAIL